MTDPEQVDRSEWLCEECGHMIDSPQHEMGCPVGRRERQVSELWQATDNAIQKLRDPERGE